jgi:hypothetical protein
MRCRITRNSIEYVFQFGAGCLLPDGQQHILCTCQAGDSYFDRAKDLGIPLCELGIATLPFKIG